MNYAVRHILAGSPYWDVADTFRVDLGNDITRAEIGFGIRSGKGLPYHMPGLIKPTFDNSKFRAYGFIDAVGKVTAYNVFIDNHLFNSGTQLDLETLGCDLSAGVAIGYGKKELSFTFVFRAPEFEGDSWHRFGSVKLAW